MLMGSQADSPVGEKIKKFCQELDIPCHVRVTSAHKGTDRTLKMLAKFEGAFISNQQLSLVVNIVLILQASAIYYIHLCLL